MPSCRMRAPSFTSAKMQRSTISSSVICRCATSSRPRLGADQLGELRVDLAFALLALVPVVTEARLLPVTAHLSEHVRTRASSAGPWADPCAPCARDSPRRARRDRRQRSGPSPCPIPRARDRCARASAPFEQHQLILAAVGVQHAIAHKAEAVADDDADLAQATRHCERCGQRRIRRRVHPEPLRQVA